VKHAITVTTLYSFSDYLSQPSTAVILPHYSHCNNSTHCTCTTWDSDSNCTI